MLKKIKFENNIRLQHLVFWQRILSANFFLAILAFTQRKMKENKILEKEFIVEEYIETAVIILYGIEYIVIIEYSFTCNYRFRYFPG